MATTEEVIIDVKTEGTQQAEKELEKVTKSTEDLTDAQEEYDKQLIESGKNAKIFGTSLNDVQKAFKAVGAGIRISIKSLGAFKAALAATGIGLFLVALQSVKTALDFNKAAQDEWARSLGAFNGVIDVFKRKISDSVTELIGLNDELEDGEKGTSLMTGAIIATTTALQSLGLISAKSAVEINGAAIAGEQAAQAQIDWNDSIQEYNLEASKQALAIELLVQKTRDLNTTNAEAFALVQQAITQFDVLAQLRIDRIDEEIAVQQKQIDAAEKGSQDRFIAEQRLIELQGQRLQVERQNSAQRRELLNREREAQNRLLADVVKGENAVINIKKKSIDTSIEGKELELDFTKKTNKATLDAERQAAQERANIAGSLASFQIDQAFAQIQASLAEALAKAFASLGPVGGAVASGVILSAFGVIRSLLSKAILPAVPQFATGGLINGESHYGPNGGVHILAEGGEYIINKRAMRVPGVAEAAEALNNAVPKYQFGGRVPDTVNPAAAFAAALANVPRTIPVLYKETLDEVNNRVAVTEQAATL